MDIQEQDDKTKSLGDEPDERQARPGLGSGSGLWDCEIVGLDLACRTHTLPIHYYYDIL